jgi:putative SOS response-associated peptidase YedK
MCGRFVQTHSARFYAQLLGVRQAAETAVPAYNAAKGDKLLVATDQELVLRTWGLGWNANVNARSETFMNLRYFAGSRRCLIPMEGFYEWHNKMPYMLRIGRGEVRLAAGIEDGDRFAILTTHSRPPVATIHNRMPVFIGIKDSEEWLDHATSKTRIQALAGGDPTGEWVIHAVTPRLNSPRAYKDRMPAVRR